MEKKKESFVLVPLQKEKAKKVAQAISNETSRRILSFIEDKNSSETEISKELGLPASTVHYNIQTLLKSGLIEQKKFRYSAKGNKIYYYGLAKKFIIISPKGMGVSVIQREIKTLLSALAVSIVATGAIKLIYQNLFVNNELPLMATRESGTLAETAKVAYTSPDIAIWFLLGALFALVAYLIIKVLTKTEA